MVEQIGPQELHALMRDAPHDLCILDVRESDERAFARIEPSLHIPMGELPRRMGELPQDRRIVVYCHSGNRSSMVAGFLEMEGFARVANLTGGIDGWSRRVDPSVPRY
jgi:rhodanese-related sulfurtransferase